MAVVTGAAGGIGLATATILARDHHVVLADLDATALHAVAERIRRSGMAASVFACDITDHRAVTELSTYALACGRLACVVHAAGVSPQMGSAEKIIRVNAAGTVHVAEAFSKGAHERFALVNVASVAGHMLPRLFTPTRAYQLALTDVDAFARKLITISNRGPAWLRSGRAYSISKSFVIWYSKALAPRFGELGARVLSVSPGSFDTRMGRLEEKSGSDRLAACGSIKRFGKPEEVAELLAFCASSKPGYLTGTDILCDGGALAGLSFAGKLRMALHAARPE